MGSNCIAHRDGNFLVLRQKSQTQNLQCLFFGVAVYFFPPSAINRLCSLLLALLPDFGA